MYGRHVIGVSYKKPRIFRISQFINNIKNNQKTCKVIGRKFERMIQTILEFIVILNPIALFLYLGPIMKELSHHDFVKVLLKATTISFAIYLVFLLSGQFICPLSAT